MVESLVGRSPLARGGGGPIAALLFALATLVTLAAAPIAAGESPARRALTPPDPEAPTAVYLNLYDLEIYSIDERQQTFEIGARISASWQDDRLAFDAAVAGTEVLVYQGEAATEALDSDVWWPAFEIVDSRGPRTLLHRELRVTASGRAFYQERFTASIGQSFYLADFPFDEHDIQLSIEPFGYDASAVVFVPPEEPSNPVSWEPTEWYLSDPELTISHGTFTACSGSGLPCAGAGDCPQDESCEPGIGFSRATVSLSIRRVANHYVWKILLPLILIILVSSAVYWMDLERFPDPGDRFTVAFTAVLTVVAFDFVTADSLPKLWYTTLMDRVLLLGYVFSALNVAGIAVTTVLSKRSPRGAERLVLMLRWLFPPVFLLTLLALTLIAVL